MYIGGGEIFLKPKNKKAFTLIEILIDIAIFSIIATAVLSAYMASFKSLELAKAKIAAVALANEKMEEIRNRPYDDLATANGPIYPPGTILDNEVLVRKGISFDVHTVIAYVDDPYDGNAEGTIPGKPQDIYPYDYKKSEITVSKVGAHGYLAKLSSNVSAKAAETSSNSGIIKFCVVDAGSQPVSEANISITNNSVSPAVNISATTADDGCIMVPNLPSDEHNNYHLSATKAGYSTDSTSPRTPQNPHVLFPDVNVLVQQVTNQTLVVDKLSSLKIDVLDLNNQPVANTKIHISGSKVIYSNPITYKYSNEINTDPAGHVDLNNIEFDDYNISVDGWNIITTSPYQTINLRPDTTASIKVYVSHDNSLPIISNVDPQNGKIGSTSSVTIIGANLNHTSIKLVNSTGNEIVGTNISYSGNNEVDADFNLNSAVAGFYNIVIADNAGNSITQENGFEVEQ